jgi:nucleoside-diphosphate-sugar epimerase
MTSSMRRAVVTGASGFIGANLAARLAAAGVEVHAIVRHTSDRWRLAPVADRLRIHALDMQDAAQVTRLLRDTSPDVIFHLATYRGSSDDYRSAYATNVGGLLNLLEAAPPGLRRFVHFGSSTEYGSRDAAIGEEAALKPATLHGLTKAAATQLACQYAWKNRLPVVVLRLFHVYGPWDRPARFIPQIVTAALSGGSIRLTPPGFRHDWTFVDDVTGAAIAAAAAPLECGEVINVASGRDWSNEKIVNTIERLCGCTIRRDPRTLAPRPHDSLRWVADVDRARRLLNWTAAWPLEAGLSATIEWSRRYAESTRAS